MIEIYVDVGSNYFAAYDVGGHSDIISMVFQAIVAELIFLYPKPVKISLFVRS